MEYTVASPELEVALGEALIKAGHIATGRAIPVESFGDITAETLGRAVIRVYLPEPAEDAADAMEAA